MQYLQTRILPRLLLDTIHTLLLAHDYVDHELRGQTRNTIVCLRDCHMTDPEKARSILRDLAPHLLKVETSLKAADRSFTAKKIGDVRKRVLFLSSAYGMPLVD